MHGCLASKAFPTPRLPKTAAVCSAPAWRLAALLPALLVAACGNESGQSAPDSIVSESQGGGVDAPTLALGASASAVAEGQGVTLTWSSTDADSCSASGAWGGVRPSSGSASTGPLTPGNKTFTLTCTGVGGSVTQSQTLTVAATPPAPAVTLNASPASVMTGQSATLSWSTSNAGSCVASGAWTGVRPTIGSAGTGPLTQPSNTFTLTCSGPGGSASQSRTVTAVLPASPPTVALSALPGNVQSGGNATLSWSSSNATSCAASGAWGGARPLSGSAGTGALTNSTNTYTLTCSGPGGSTSQSRTVTVSAAPPQPTLTLNAAPSNVSNGGSATLTWSSTDADSCSASGAWSGGRPTSGSAGTGALTAASNTFTLTCSGAGGSASRSQVVTVTQEPEPTVSLDVSPSSVASGGSATLTWSSTDADSCSASGAWSGGRPTSGSVGTGALTAASNTFTLTCSGAGGSASRSQVVTVTQEPEPTVSLDVSPSSVASGGSATLTWSSTDADSCSASGAWSGGRPTSGSAGTGALTAASNTFTLTCSGAGGSASRSQVVTVTQEPEPTVSLDVSPSSVASGGSATLTWSSTDADSCSASGAWNGARATAGSESTTPLTETTNTFTLTCANNSNSTSISRVVTVDGAGISGLDFPSNQIYTPSIRFKFTGANLNPIYPATYIWRVKLRQQNGYYTTFFWGNDDGQGTLDTFLWGSPYGDPDSYYGAHPYPSPPPNGSVHKWEISAYGLDTTSPDFVQYGRWYQQALVVWQEGNVARHEFYYDLPDTSKKVSYSTPGFSNYGAALPPSPALTFGDAPWNLSQERLSGILRGIQIYDVKLSLADIQAEIAAPQSTAAGSSGIWYLNLNPTPSDIADKSGNNHNPQWVGSGRPQLWSSP